MVCSLTKKAEAQRDKDSMKKKSVANVKETSDRCCLRRCVRRLFEARQELKAAKKAVQAKGAELGQCADMHEADEYGDYRGPCYNSQIRPKEKWCAVCQAKLPYWEDYHKKANAAGAALRAVLKLAQSLPPNDQAEPSALEKNI